MSKAEQREQGSKARDRLDAVEQRIAALDERSVGLQRALAESEQRMAERFQTAFEQRCVAAIEQLERYHAACSDEPLQPLRAALEHAKVQIKDLQKQLADLQRETCEALDKITRAGGITLSCAAVLDADDLAQLLADEPGRRLICVSGSTALGLQPGEAFDPRAKFANATQAVQFARGGTAFAAAPT